MILSLADSFNVPIYIINFNQLTFLEPMIDQLSFMGYRKIIVLDNKSTYPPLIKYYKNLPLFKAKVIYLEKNYGHKALYASGIYKSLQKSFFVLTDPDLIFPKDFPRTFVYDFAKLIEKYGIKVGTALKIDDVLKNQVIGWERQFWQNEIEPGTYLASLDTTMALYGPNFYEKFPFDDFQTVHPAIRVAKNYVVKHAPWYFTVENLPDDYRFYNDIIIRIKENEDQTTTNWSLKL